LILIGRQRHILLGRCDIQTLYDCWEGSLELEEEVVRAGGIVGLIIRINSITGGHHMDENFLNQWNQSVNFLRAPYFVYNPWSDAHANYQWLMRNLPSSGVTRLFIDVEVKYTGYSAEVYADEVQKFITEIKAIYPLTVIYTGQWFLPFLSHWPTGSYWWARYPFRFYPPSKENWTYEKLEVETEKYGYFPDPQKKCPGTVDVWQCSGDRLILPGCANRPIDVNLFNGTLEELETWWGAKLPTGELTLKQKVDVLWREAEKLQWNLSP
jgi:GH25 family lysozyme M1 (1,4-beta-N-acetylmuramidase)